MRALLERPDSLGVSRIEQNLADLLEPDTEIAQAHDAREHRQLRRVVSPIPVAVVDLGRHEQSDRVVVPQHPHAHPPEGGELSNGVHEDPYVRA